MVYLPQYLLASWTAGSQVGRSKSWPPWAAELGLPQAVVRRHSGTCRKSLTEGVKEYLRLKVSCKSKSQDEICSHEPLINLAAVVSVGRSESIYLEGGAATTPSVCMRMLLLILWSARRHQGYLQTTLILVFCNSRCLMSCASQSCGYWSDNNGNLSVAFRAAFMLGFQYQMLK